MNDFKRWINYHAGAFPGFGRWMRDNPDQLDHMERLLGHYALEDLTEATDALYASDTQPGGYGSHGRAIRRLCNPDGPTGGRPEGPELRDGTLVASCSRCMDYGMIEVVSPSCLRSLYKHADRPVGEWVQTCMVACDCSLGGRKARKLRIPQWSSRSALIPYLEILDEAEGGCEWSIARERLLELDDKRRQPQPLTGNDLP